MKELPKRIFVAVLGIPLLLFIIYQGGIYFFGLTVVIDAAGQWELYKMSENRGAKPQRYIGILFGLLLLGAVQFGNPTWLAAVFFSLIIIIFAAEMFRNTGSALLNTGSTLLGIFYPAVFLAAMIYLRNNVNNILPAEENAGAYFTIALFISIWICDTFAYFFGKAFGKHKLFQRVSPNKTIEGAAAGVAGALLVFILLRISNILLISWEFAVICGLLSGIIGQLGDLVESWFKRDAGVKDSSNLLPGHGGMLDRFDSLLFVSPAYLILYFLWV